MPYKLMKFIMNQLFLALKLQFKDDHISVIDGLIADILSKNLSTVKNDYFSLLHLLVTMLKETSESGKRRFKKTIRVVLTSIEQIDVTKFKSIGDDRALKDELERIV
jgi:hypothetical protein